jgi:RNAse (barnase) inhibitor barstar
MTTIVEIEFAGITTKGELHAQLARAFDFPAYYGANWDAFNDCIVDAVLGHPDGMLIRCRGFDGLEARLPREASMLRERLKELIFELPTCCVEWTA